jgi:hypothetical protein
MIMMDDDGFHALFEIDQDGVEILSDSSFKAYFF